MSYKFRARDGSVEAGVRRIAAEQLESAIESLGTAGGKETHEAVHDARKSVKKVRGLLRLVRGAFPGYKAENAYLRDAARLLSDLRDRTAYLEAFDRITERHSGDVDRRTLAPLRRELTRDRQAEMDAPDLSDRIERFRDSLAQARAASETWSLTADGWDAIAPGLARTYDRARAAMAVAEKGRDGHEMHEWRKRVKYHWYHTRLLERIWPEGLESHRRAADTLSDILGDHHDIVVFEGRLAASGLGEKPRAAMAKILARDKARLEREAFALGPRLLADKPKALLKRWHTWWDLGDVANAA